MGKNEEIGELKTRIEEIRSRILELTQTKESLMTELAERVAKYQKGDRIKWAYGQNTAEGTVLGFKMAVYPFVDYRCIRIRKDGSDGAVVWVPAYSVFGKVGE